MNDREEAPKSILKKVSQFDCVSYGSSDGGRTRVKTEKSIRFSFETADGAEVARNDRHVRTKPKKKRSSVGENRAGPAKDVDGNEVPEKGTVSGNGDGTSTRKASRKEAIKERGDLKKGNAHSADPFQIVTGRQNVETRGETEEDRAGKKAPSTESLAAGSAAGIQMKTEETDEQKRQGNRRRKKRRRKRRRGRGKGKEHQNNP